MKTWWKKNKEIAILPPLEAYNYWSATYAQESNPVKDLSDQFVAKFLPELSGKVLLDAGCGTGKFCLLAEQQKALQVTGIDLSPAMIDIARIHCSDTKFTCGDLSTIIHNDRYDVIICALVMGHLENITPALDNLLKSLQPGGYLMLTDFHPLLTLMKSKRTFYHRDSGKSFEVRHFLHLFEEYFKCFHRNGVVVEILEEPLYKGTPVVFGMRVQKP